MKQIQELIQERKDRGFAMAKQERPKYKNGVWLVRSASNPRQQYQVSLELDGAKCNCEDFKERGIYGIKCKHYWSVEHTLTQTELHSDGSITQTTVTKLRPIRRIGRRIMRQALGKRSYTLRCSKTTYATQYKSQQGKKAQGVLLCPCEIWYSQVV